MQNYDDYKKPANSKRAQIGKLMVQTPVSKLNSSQRNPKVAASTARAHGNGGNQVDEIYLQFLRYKNFKESNMATIQ